MFFRQIKDPVLAQYAYLIGCQKTGEAIVVDPLRDVDRYVQVAESEGLRLVAVTETHIHADFLSGSRELGQRGLRVYLSEAGTDDWQYGWAAGDDVALLGDGDEIQLGKITLRALHTPGHTPEHLSFLVIDGARGEMPMGLLSGDFLFVGDVGRPDLLDTAAGADDTQEPAARTLYRSILEQRELADALQLFPGHGSGSACGKALGAVPYSTLGYERQTSPALEAVAEGEQAFVDYVLDAQPEPPFYFGRMKRLNRDGPPILGSLPEPAQMELADLDRDEVTLLDTRSDRAAFMAGHLPGSLFAPLGSGVTTAAGNYVPGDGPVALVIDPKDVDDAVRTLIRIGVDRIVGTLPLDVLKTAELESTPRVEFSDVDALVEEGAFVLDVRGEEEWRDAHLEDSHQIAHTRLLEHAGELPEDRKIVVHCASGKRAAFAASFLASRGLDVVHVDDTFSSGSSK